jgi:hypothetical protein
MQSQSIGLLKGLETIRVHAQELYQDFERLHDTMIEIYKHPSGSVPLVSTETRDVEKEKLTETKMILDEFRDLMHDASSITGVETNLKDSRHLTSLADAKAVLTQICIECDMAIGILNASILPISSEDMDRLSKLREELSAVSASLDVNYEKNLTEAIVEQEKGHFLASALITARVIEYILDQIEGKDINEKIKNLRDKAIIGKVEKRKADEEEFIIKAEKKARNIFSHEIKNFVNPSESLSMLGDCVRLLRMCAVVLRRTE